MRFPDEVKRDVRMLLFLLLLGTAVSLGQHEFPVNTFRDSTQRAPRIARNTKGNCAVVWQSINQAGPASQNDIYLQRFNSGGERIRNEILVNAVTAGDQKRPALAFGEEGTIIIVYESLTSLDSADDIKGSLLKGNEPAGPEFLVNSTIANSQCSPDVAADTAGHFIVVWESWLQDGSDRGVYARLFDTSGTPHSGEFRVNEVTSYSQARPRVKYLSNGDFIVVWESWLEEARPGTGYDLFARIFTPEGIPLSGEFRVNTYTEDNQWFSDIAAFSDGSFTVTWCSWGEDGDEGGIYLQRFDPGGARSGSEVQVNTTTKHYQWLPRIVALDKKRVAVVWSSWLQDGSREGVYLQCLDSTGARVSPETQVNEYTDNYQWEPDVIETNDGSLFVVWSSWGEFKKDYDIFRRTLKAGSY